MTSTSPVFSYQPQQSGGAMESNLQVSIPNQNSSLNKVKKLGGVIKGLGIASIVLSLTTLICGIAEVSIRTCRTHYYSFGVFPEVSCFFSVSIGQGIWCSVFPLIAGIFGIVAGKSAKSQAKISLVMGFSIVGAIFSSLLVILQPVFLTINLFLGVPAIFALQIVITVVAFVNFVLLIVTASFSCCLSNSCCGNTSTAAPQIVYIPYPNQPATTIVPTLSLQPGYSQQQPTFNLPQGSSPRQNYSKNAPTLSAPPKYDNIDKKMPVN